MLEDKLNIDGMMADHKVLPLKQTEKQEYDAEELSVLEDAAAIEKRRATAKTFISDNYLKVTDNCTVLLAGQTGKGKTTVMFSAAVHEMLRGGYVGFFTNEMSQADIRTDIKEALQNSGISDREALTLVAHKLKVFHSDKHKELTFYDRVYDFILKETVANKFTLVFFDQLTGALEDSKSGKVEEAFKAMDRLVKKFKAWQSNAIPLPPVVMAQQANPPSQKEGKGVPNMMAHLRSAKGTIEHVCLGILITSDEASSRFVIGKIRKNFTADAFDKMNLEVVFNRVKAIYEVPKLVSTSDLLNSLDDEV